MVDACPKCRGLWLDRGELEKLIARANRELEDLGWRREETPPQETRYRDHDHDQRRYHKKRSFFDSLGDIFD